MEGLKKLLFFDLRASLVFFNLMLQVFSAAFFLFSSAVRIIAIVTV